MPYTSDRPGLRIAPADDRRRKLTEDQREQIRQQAAQGASQRQLAAAFGVSRRLVQYILDPEKEARGKELYAARQRDGRYYDREKHAEQVRATRRHRHRLYAEGRLEEPPAE